MIHLGFKHESHQKFYYVYNEATENFKDRNDFIKRYFEYELCYHCWISITATERENLINEGMINKYVFWYKYEKMNCTFLNCILTTTAFFKKDVTFCLYIH